MAPGPAATVIPVVASDGASASLELLRAPGAESPALLFLPAMGVEARHYRSFAAALRELGVHAASLDLRGMGTSSVRAGRGSDYGYATMVGDVKAAAAALRSELPSSPLFLGGHSLGGHLSALLAATGGASAAGLSLVASGTPYFRGFPGRDAAGLLVYSQVVRAVARALGYFPGNRLGFGGRQGRRLMDEWAHLVRTGTFAPRSWPHRPAEEALGALALPVLGVALEGDRFAPDGAVDHLLGKLGRCAVARTRVRRSAEPEATHHIRWLRHSRPVAEIVAHWIHETASSPPAGSGLPDQDRAGVEQGEAAPHHVSLRR